MPYYIDEGRDSGRSPARATPTLADFLRRVIQPIIRIIQPVIRAVQEIIRGTAGGGGSQTVPTQTGSGSTEGTSGGRADSAGRTGSQSVQSQPKKPPEYGEFDDTPAWPGVSQSRRMAGYNFTGAQFASSDLREAARGSLLAQDVLLALRHEGNPSHLANEKFLKQFARYGWDDQETAQAYEVFEIWLQEQLALQEADPEFDPFVALTNMTTEYLVAQYRAGDSEARFSAAAISRLLREAESSGNPEDYARLLESIAGYNIEFGSTEFSDQEKQQQLVNLATSNLLTIQYLDSVLDRTETTGLEAFNQYFAQSPYSDDVAQRITVYVGDDTRSDGAYFGRVPLPTSPSQRYDENFRNPGLSSIYLGSLVTAATITHEFFHQLDRYFRGDLSTGDGSNITSFGEYVANTVINQQTGDIFRTSNIGGLNVLLARANQSDLYAEVFGDLGMTAVISFSQEVYYVRPDNLPPPVGFVSGTNAADIECAARQYLRQILNGTYTGLVYDPEFCE